MCVDTGTDVTVIQIDLVDDNQLTGEYKTVGGFDNAQGKLRPMAKVEIEIGHLKLTQTAAVVPNNPTAAGVLLSVKLNSPELKEFINLSSEADSQPAIVIITRAQTLEEQKKEIEDQIVEKNDALQPKKPEEISTESTENYELTKKTLMKQNDLLLACPIAIPGETDRGKLIEDTKIRYDFKRVRKGKQMKIEIVFIGMIEFSRKQYATILKKLANNL